MKKSRYLIASVFLVLGLGFGLMTQVVATIRVNAQELQAPQPVNEPLGTAKGVMPGRVVWEHNPNATNENCTNSAGDYWLDDDNTDQAVVRQMLSSGLQKLTETASDAEAWDAIFKYYNNNHEKGDVGYEAGEKIAIKINMNGHWNGLSAINTSPQLCYAILDQLVNVAGVAQEDISMGDPNVTMNDQTYNHLAGNFPDVTYWGNGAGRISADPTASTVLFSSDGVNEDQLPQAYVDAEYMINIPVFKKHHRAGISITSKNHFGSFAPYSGGAWHYHYSLPCPEADGPATNTDYGVYRCFVDIMGHKDLGGKTILYLVDGLWASTNWGHGTVKFQMSPFNDDWCSSLFLSQDPVAIESVCYDFLLEEFEEGEHEEDGEHEFDPNGDYGPFPQFPGVDDFLHQAADPSTWPANIEYDPENDGSVLASMGTHEHWNNSTDKQYSRNLDIGTGIELVSPYVVTATEKIDYVAAGFEMLQNYPNPFSGSTTIRYHLAIPSSVSITVYNTSGAVVYHASESQLRAGNCEHVWNAENISSGMYICKMQVSNARGNFEMSKQLIAN